MSTGLKTVKGGKTEAEPEVVKRTMRGVEYTIRELDVTEYKDCLKAATNAETGLTPFQDLLDMMVMRAITPSPASLSKPMPYPIYRTLEDIVNTMHFRDVPEDKAPEEPKADGDEAETETPAEEAVPNS